MLATSKSNRDGKDRVELKRHPPMMVETLTNWTHYIAAITKRLQSSLCASNGDILSYSAAVDGELQAGPSLPYLDYCLARTRKG